MGLDLELLPLRGRLELVSDSVSCYDRLTFEPDYEIFGQIINLSRDCEDVLSSPTVRTHPIPPGLWVILYTDEGLERTREDRYGRELTFAYAEQLKRLKVKNGTHPKNRAIIAFVNALPDDTPIILRW